MKIVFTKHAGERMKERNIKKSEVKEAILYPHRIMEKLEQRIIKNIRKNGQLLIIYIVDERKLVRVITVITTSKLSKYLKNE